MRRDFLRAKVLLTVGAFPKHRRATNTPPGWDFRPSQVIPPSISHVALTVRRFPFRAVSTKVVPQKRNSARDNADWYYG